MNKDLEKEFKEALVKSDMGITITETISLGSCECLAEQTVKQLLPLLAEAKKEAVDDFKKEFAEKYKAMDMDYDVDIVKKELSEMKGR